MACSSGGEGTIFKSSYLDPLTTKRSVLNLSPKNACFAFVYPGKKHKLSSLSFKYGSIQLLLAERLAA